MKIEVDLGPREKMAEAPLCVRKAAYLAVQAKLSLVGARLRSAKEDKDWTPEDWAAWDDATDEMDIAWRWLNEQERDQVSRTDSLLASLCRADKIRYVKGDATCPQGGGNKIVAHVCNDVGAWGAGFVLAVSKRWPQAEAAYRGWHKFGKLGEIQMVVVGSDIFVANMMAQRGFGWSDGKPPICYDALRSCLKHLAITARRGNATIHMPRIGCGLAGGKWETVESIIQEELISTGLDVTVYDYEKG